MERHQSVRGAFLTWKEFLTENNLLNAKYQYLRVDPPGALAIDRGIDDKARRTSGAAEPEAQPAGDDKQEPAETDNEEEGSLFTWKPS